MRVHLMDGNGFFKKLTNNQLQGALLTVTLVVAVVSFIEPLTLPVLLAMVLVTPLVFGYCAALLFDYADKNVDYQVCMNKNAHILLAILVSLIIGALAKQVATIVPIVPYTAQTNALFLVVHPKIVFFLWGVITALVGYWQAYKSFKK